MSARRDEAAGRRRPRGFTLVEVAIVSTVAALLVTVAWPSQKAQLQRARRADAVAALTRVQLAQEQHRAHHGLYAASLAALTGAASPRSPEGYYQISIEGAGGSTVVVAASARAGSTQASDGECTRLTIALNDGLADYGPNERCWNR